MDGNVRKNIPQTFWMVSWSQPDSKGRIDYLDGESSGTLCETRQEALRELKTDPSVPDGAYLVKLTYQRDSQPRRTAKAAV